MGIAIVGVLGVIAGALATSGTQLWLTSRQRRNDALAAARLTWGALEEARAVLEGSLEAGRWTVGATGMERVLSVWYENRVAVARSVNSADYRTLEIAFVGLRETLEQAGSFDNDGFESVSGDPRLPQDLAWIRLARSVALRAGQTRQQRKTDTQDRGKLLAEVERELRSDGPKTPAKKADKTAPAGEQALAGDAPAG